MVLLASLEDWQKQTGLLLQARPTTTRITTKYNIPNLSAAKYNKPSSKSKDTSDKKEDEKTPRATITLKAHDTASGVTLKFKTDRAADVGRLIAGLGTLGRQMAALPEKAEVKDVAMEDVAAAPTAQTPQQPPTGNTAGKKKKKGKK